MNRMTMRWGIPILALWLAFLARVWGLPSGLPFEFHPDEGQYVNEALNWLVTGQLHPGTVNPPLFIYVLAAALKAWLTLSPFESAPAWVIAAYTFARLWSVVFGLLTVALVFAAGRRMHSVSVGLAAMVLYGGLFLPARESHFAVNDTAATFFALLTIYGSIGILRRGHRADYALAGVALGLAAAAKLNLALVMVAPLAAHILAVAPAGYSRFRAIVTHRRAWGSFGLALLTFAVISLPLLLDASRLVENIGKHLQFGSEGYKGLQMAPAGGWLYYLTILGWGVGWLVLAAALTGLGWVLATRFRPGYVVAIFPLTLFFYMGAQKILFARFLLPATPSLAILAAVGTMLLTSRWPRHRRWLGPLVLAAMLAQPLAYLFRFDYLLTRPDTRQLASNWLAAEFPPDTVLVKESYSVFPAQFIVSPDWPFKTIQIDERGPTRNDDTYYLAHKTNLIALSNFTYGRARQAPVEEAARRRQLALLNERAELLKTFNPYQVEPDWFYLDELYGPAGEVLQRTAPGPLIKIYRLPYESQPYSIDIPPISTPLNANFGNKLTLLGYDLPERRAEAGGAIPITLYWQALNRPDETYVSFNRLLDDRQQSWGGYDRWPQETSNTTLWHPGEVVIDTFGLPVAAAAPDGIYTIDIGLYNQADPAGTPLALVQDGYPIDQTSVRLGPVKIGTSPLAAGGTAKPQHPLNLALGQPPVITLLGYDVAQTAATIQLTLFWQSAAQTPLDWSVFVHLRDAAGQTVAQKDGPAGSGRYPASLWDAGDIITDTLTIPLPASLPPGEYQPVVGMYNLADGTRLPVPGYPESALPLNPLTVTP